jgi:hypothetical protein
MRSSAHTISPLLRSVFLQEPPLRAILCRALGNLRNPDTLPEDESVDVAASKLGV